MTVTYSGGYQPHGDYVVAWRTPTGEWIMKGRQFEGHTFLAAPGEVKQKHLYEELSLF